MNESDASSVSHMSQLPEQDLAPRFYQPGEVVEGEVVRMDDDGMVVSVGQKMEGIVTLQEMRSMFSGEKAQYAPGETVRVAIVGGGGPDGMVLLSLDQALAEQKWQELEQAFSEGKPVIARITEHNRGGLVVDCRGIRGFIPFSHLAPVQGDDKEATLAARVCQESEFHILELDRSLDRLVLSERAIWQRQQGEAQDRFLAGLEEGALLSGKVSSIRDFGAFVDLGGMEGLIPISELSWSMVKTPGDVVKVGDAVDVYVIRVDLDRRRLTLSLKRTQPEPWETVHQRYQVGQVAEGTVTNLVPFGAFVKLEEGIEGLVHISELSQRRVTNPRECVYQGQHVKVMVLTIDVETRRMSLSYKQAFGF